MRYLRFKRDSFHRDDEFSVMNTKNEYLGRVSYYFSWGKFVFTPSESVVFDIDCLGEIIKFIEGLKK